MVLNIFKLKTSKTVACVKFGEYKYDHLKC